jgi:hypothetical protein
MPQSILVEETRVVGVSELYRELVQEVFIILNTPDPAPETKAMREVATLNAITTLTEILGDEKTRQDIHRILTPLATVKREEMKEQFAEFKKYIEAFTPASPRRSNAETLQFGGEDWMYWYGMYLMELRSRGSREHGGKVQ